MRILHVIQELHGGGAERVVAALVRGSVAAGAECAVAAAPQTLVADLPAQRWPLRMIERRPTRLAGATGDLRAAVRGFRPQVCHVHQPAVAAAATVATRRGRRPRGLVTVHGLPDEDYGRAARLLRWSGLSVVSCGPGVDEALRTHGLRPDALIPNGVAPGVEPLDRRDLAGRWGLPADATIVVCVGRLAPVKNQQLAVRAAALLPADVRLVLVGAGPDEADLRGLADGLGVGERVVFAGEVAQAAAVAAAADVVVSASRSEGMPLALVEAMAAGRPVVATRVRGSRDLVDDGRTGLLVPPDDPAALAAAVQRLRADADLGRRLGTAAAAATAGFTEAAMVTAYLRLYEELTA